MISAKAPTVWLSGIGPDRVSDKNRGALSLTLAVAEQGKTGFDDKAASAELAAIKAAIGPALSEGVKAKYAPDD